VDDPSVVLEMFLWWTSHDPRIVRTPNFGPSPNASQCLYPRGIANKLKECPYAYEDGKNKRERERERENL